MSKQTDKTAPAESCRIVLPGREEDGGLTRLSSLDRLDRAALTVLLFLLLAAALILAFQPGGHPGDQARSGGGGRRNVLVINPELDRQLALAANLLDSGDPTRARELLDSLIASFPYEGGPRLLKGDLFLRLQQPVPAMLEYRQAVDLNPDYLDKKMTEVFQGKKIKNTLEEARLAIDAGLAQNPGDGDLRRQREILYYMLRKVAGSCG